MPGPLGAGKSPGKDLWLQVHKEKSWNSCLVHKSKVVGDLNIVVILKLCEGMHFSQSKNARLLNFVFYFAGQNQNTDGDVDVDGADD